MPLTPFGIYRPVNSASTKPLLKALFQAQTTVNSNLQNFEPIRTFDKFGITFVQRQHVSAQLDKLRQSGFSINLFLEQIAEELEPDNTQDLPLDFDSLAWLGARKHKLGFRLADSRGRRMLNKQAQQLRKIFQENGAEPSLVRVPDHISIAIYGKNWGNHTLPEQQRKRVAWIFTRYLKGMVGAVTVNSLVVGKGYDQPLFSKN